MSILYNPSGGMMESSEDARRIFALIFPSAIAALCCSVFGFPRCAFDINSRDFWLCFIGVRNLAACDILIRVSSLRRSPLFAADILAFVSSLMALPLFLCDICSQQSALLLRPVIDFDIFFRVSSECFLPRCAADILARTSSLAFLPLFLDKPRLDPAIGAILYPYSLLADL